MLFISMPFVVYLYLLIRIQVIPDEHLLLPSYEGCPHLDRRKPVDIEMGDHIVVEMCGDICGIFYAFTCAFPVDDIAAGFP